MFKKYLNDSSGQFAIMFSLASTMLLVGMGAAVDIIGAHKTRVEMQRLSDLAALAAASSRDDNPANIKKIAQAAIDANNPLGLDIKVKTSFVDDVVKVVASTNYDTKVMGFTGYKDIPVASASEALMPREFPINVSLVLDRTGSMSGDNMTSLKSASSKLLDVFDSMEGDVRASVIPFSNYVNIGMENRYAPWMDVPEDSAVTSDEQVCRKKKDLVNPDQCTYEDRTRIRDGVSVTYKKRVCPASAYGPEYDHCYYPTSRKTWYGCAGSRDANGHLTPAYKGNRVPGVMNVRCGEEVLPLTINMTTVKNKIDSLSASGNTYIPAGLIWGWRMLNHEQPFNDLSNSQKDRKRALVLMTDGANTKSLKQPFHSGNDAAEADTLTETLCTKIKDEDIQVFTVAYKLEGSSGTKDVIRRCATSPAFFFDASSTEELEAAFENIGNALYEVRLSK